MPSRIVREGIIDSRAVNSLSEAAEIFYRRLMSIVDDFGRFNADPEILRARLFPLQLDRWPLARIRQALAEVSRAHTDEGNVLVLIYQVGTKKYLELNNFGQRLRTSRSKFPEPSARDLAAARREIDGQMTDTCPPFADNCQQTADIRGGSRPNSESDSEAYSESESDAHSEDAPLRGANVITLPAAGEQAIGELAERMYARHPKKKNLVLVPGAIKQELAISPDPAALAVEIETVHAEWCSTHDWSQKNGRFAPKLDEWITDKGYTIRPSRDSPQMTPAQMRRAELMQGFDMLDQIRGGKNAL